MDLSYAALRTKWTFSLTGSLSVPRGVNKKWTFLTRDVKKWTFSLTTTRGVSKKWTYLTRHEGPSGSFHLLIRGVLVKSGSILRGIKDQVDLFID